MTCDLLEVALTSGLPALVSVDHGFKTPSLISRQVQGPNFQHDADALKRNQTAILLLRAERAERLHSSCRLRRELATASGTMAFPPCASLT